MADDALSDADIIRLSLGEPEQFGLLFDRHYGAVYSYAVRSIGRTEGQDVASETFVQAFKSRQRFDLLYRSARPWLLGIASNLISNRYRSFERRNRAYGRAIGHVQAQSEFEVAATERVDAGVHAERVRAALEALRPKERTVVTLFVFAGLSYREISEALGLNERTVKSRLSRGRMNLRNLLSDVGEQWGSDE